MINYTVKTKKNPIDQTSKFYPQIAKQDYVSLKDVASEISGMCTVTLPDIVSVLSALQEQVEAVMRSGRSVRFGYLGSFRPTIVGKGTKKKEDVTEKLIERVRIRFTSGSYLRNKLKKESVRFKLVK